MNFSFLSIFHHFKRAFIEAYKTIFLEGETPTITIHSIIKNIFSCSVKCIEYSFSVVNLVFYPTSFLLFINLSTIAQLFYYYTLNILMKALLFLLLSLKLLGFYCFLFYTSNMKTILCHNWIKILDELLKGYLRYKTIFCNKVVLDW